MNEQPQKRYLLTRWIMLLVFLLLGIFVGQRMAMHPNALRIDTGRELGKLELIFEQIRENYVDTVNVGEILESALPFVMEELDPHSIYIPATEMSQANETIEGNFDGIGISFNMPNDTVVVMGVIAGGPSEKAGIIAGDRIITISDTAVAGRKIDQQRMVNMLRGKSGTKVKIGIARTGENKLVHFTVSRDKIPVISVDAAHMIDAATGFIRVSKFSKTTHDEFVAAIEKLQAQGMKKLVLDLRDNSGGLLDQAFEVANEFLEEHHLIVYTEGRHRPRHDFYATGRGRCKDMPLWILINERTASAGEIVAGAIQDNDRGTIIGRRSFGKALVQEPIIFSDRSGIRLTVARYYTPTGRCIQKPYDRRNKSAYENELYERYRNGEMNTSDSSKFEGEQYRTAQGKIVYGGGGIMPDIFVPLDTIVSQNSYYLAVSRRNIPFHFVWDFTDRHRAALNSLKKFDQLQAYLNNHALDVLFRAYAEEYGEKGEIAGEEEWQACRPVINAQLRALVGRNTPLADDAYFMLIAPVDNVMDTVKKAIEN